MDLTPTDNNVEKRNLSYKNYELKDHLGNVRLTFSDWKVKGSSVFELDVKSINNYYPFGMPQDSRSYNANDYRYSFNTQEKTLEIASDGSHTTAEFWEYSGKTGRRWNLDPRPNPSLSNYSAFGGNPIFNTDHYGDSLQGTTPESAQKLLNKIKNDVFEGKQFNKFKDLIQISPDGVTFNRKISEQEFIDAINDLTIDEQALAYG